jgi:cytosine/adenosine deaminase-related metal-dependent hydrolase
MELCTSDAASAVGRSGELGIIAPGAAADLVACRISVTRDPTSAYVLGGSPEAIQCVVVSGQTIWRNDMNRLTEAREAASEARALLALPVKL